MAASTGLQVLAISADTRFLREVRLVAPLGALAEAGLIRGFRIFNPVDGGLSDHFPHQDFNAVLVQRDAPEWVLEHLAKRGLPFLYDIDDLLLGSPAYSPGAVSPAVRQRVVRALGLCRMLGVSNKRLLEALERHAGLPLGHKAVLIPNGLPGDASAYRQPWPGGDATGDVAALWPKLPLPPEGLAPAPARPTALLWTTSDRPALGRSASAVIGAVGEFSASRGLPILLAGRFDPELTEELPGARFLGNMDYWRHKLFLAQTPSLLCIAPLETEADAATLEFIACKSDVKMVEYGGLGHPGVYSQSPPYADTDIVSGRLTQNTRAAWLDSLEDVCARGFATASGQAHAIAARRSMDVVARQCWLPALEAVRLDRPLSVETLRGRFGGSAETGPQPLHHRLADRLYHGLYRRLVPDAIKQRIGAMVERKLNGGDG